MRRAGPPQAAGASRTRCTPSALCTRCFSHANVRLQRLAKQKVAMRQHWGMHRVRLQGSVPPLRPSHAPGRVTRYFTGPGTTHLSPIGMLPVRLGRARAAACLLLQQRVDALRCDRLVHLHRPDQASPGGVRQPSLRQPQPPRSPLRRAAASRAPAAQRRWALGRRRGSSMSGPGTWPPPAAAGPPWTRARSQHTSEAAAAPRLLRRT